MDIRAIIDIQKLEPKAAAFVERAIIDIQKLEPKAAAFVERAARGRN